MQLAPIFTDNMVLQREKEVFIFGESECSEIITVKIDDTETTYNAEKGWWYFALPAHQAGGPYDMVVTSRSSDMEGEEVVIRNVMYGEVFLNNGQSNIEFELKDSEGGLESIEEDNYPDIRYFNVFKTGSVYEAIKNKDLLSWKQAKDKSFGDISAIGYYYALRLHKELGVAIGMIDCYVGGTSITCWLSKERLESSLYGKAYYDEYYAAIEKLPDNAVELYEKTVEEYDKKTEEIQRRIKGISASEIVDAIGKYPWPPPQSEDSLFRLAALERAMLKTVYSYTLRSAVYYQGEEDAVNNFKNLEKTGRNDYYYSFLEALIEEYRSMFRDDKLPVILIQLPMYIEDKEDKRDWAYIREAQDSFAEAHVGVFLTALTDTGEYFNVHPLDKKTPGMRVAGTILEKVFDIPVGLEMSIKDINREGESIVLYFNNTYGEIKTMENSLFDLRNEDVDEAESDTHVYGFEICSEVGMWYQPKVCIEGDRLIIKEKEKVTGVRYGFFNYGKVNLYNSKGLPLKQFCYHGDV